MGYLSPFVILFLSIFMYYTLIYILIFKNNFYESIVLKIYMVLYLILTHLFIVLTVYCYIATMLKTAGKPPKFWGFYFDDLEDKKKRMCLICYNFKPERCHHCSTCGWCVLVMDHHCPWINNCIGFFNKKFFMLLLFYSGFLINSVILNSIYPIC